VEMRAILDRETKAGYDTREGKHPTRHGRREEERTRGKVHDDCQSSTLISHPIVSLEGLDGCGICAMSGAIVSSTPFCHLDC